MDDGHTLRLNAFLKYYEFILGSFDQASGEKTIGNLKEEFHTKFKCDPPVMINQYFGLIRLLPLMYIAEERFGDEGEKEVIRCIRNAFAHNSIDCNENGYTFHPNRPDKESISMSYSEIVSFVHKLENKFYSRGQTGKQAAPE